MEMSVTAETSDLLPDHHQPSQLHRLLLLSTISYLHVDTTQYVIINHNYDNDNDTYIHTYVHTLFIPKGLFRIKINDDSGQGGT